MKFPLFLLFLVALVYVVARTAGFFAPKLEVANLACNQVGSGFEATGSVTNVSGDDLSLSANVLLRSVDRPGRFDGPVLPDPVGAGATGQFRVRGALPPYLMTGGEAECWIEGFTDQDQRTLGVADVTTAVHRFEIESVAPKGPASPFPSVPGGAVRR